MVRISGTLTSNVTLSGRMAGGGPQSAPNGVEPVQKPDKPVFREDRKPDMTFGGIGRRIDIRV